MNAIRPWLGAIVSAGALASLSAAQPPVPVSPPAHPQPAPAAQVSPYGQPGLFPTPNPNPPRPPQPVVRTAPDLRTARPYYTVNCYGMVYGPHYWLVPPFPPFNGMLPAPMKEAACYNPQSLALAQWMLHQQRQAAGTPNQRMGPRPPVPSMPPVQSMPPVPPYMYPARPMAYHDPGYGYDAWALAGWYAGYWPMDYRMAGYSQAPMAATWPNYYVPQVYPGNGLALTNAAAASGGTRVPAIPGIPPIPQAPGMQAAPGAPIPGIPPIPPLNGSIPGMPGMPIIPGMPGPPDPYMGNCDPNHQIPPSFVTHPFARSPRDFFMMEEGDPTRPR